MRTISLSIFAFNAATLALAFGVDKPSPSFGRTRTKVGYKDLKDAPFATTTTTPTTKPDLATMLLKNRNPELLFQVESLLEQPKTPQQALAQPAERQSPASIPKQNSRVTLTRYMSELTTSNPDLQDMESVVDALQVSCKSIAKMVRSASLDDLTGYDDSTNVHGEQQKKLDLLTNDVLKAELQRTAKVGALASEEEDEVVYMGSHRYVAAFDPLDGSSNVDAGIPVGTIFGISERSRSDPTGANALKDTLQPGNNLVAAGYCLYSSATTLVLTLGNGVQGFTLDESIGEFVLTHPSMTIPSRGTIYSMNESNHQQWEAPLQSYVDAIQQGKGETHTKYCSRYVGSMVADVHRTLQYGGVFGYPADSKNRNGKLRLLYEAAPMAFLMEQAGGLAVSRGDSIMDIEPTELHQRVPCMMGSSEDIEEMLGYYERN